MNTNIVANLIDNIRKSEAIFVITGSSGWIGRALIEVLNRYLGKQFKTRVIAFSSSAVSITLSNYDIVKCLPLCDISLLPDDKNYILFHLAFLTKDKVAKMGEQEYIQQNISIRENISKFIKKVSIECMIYTSSGAVYNSDRSLCNDIKTNPYGALKVEDENYFINLISNKGETRKIIIPRIFNIAGPYINKWQVYAISDFIVQAIQNKQIVINAKSSVVRSYMHINDLINLLLILTFDGLQHQLIFDTVGKQIIELSELARYIINTLNLNIQVNKDYDITLPDDNYYGDGLMQNKILKKHQYSLSDIDIMIHDTFNYLRLQGVFSTNSSN